MTLFLLIIVAFGALWALAWLREPKKRRCCLFFDEL